MSSDAPGAFTIRGRTFRRPPVHDTRFNWVLIGMWILLILYWFLMAWLERVDGEIVVTTLLARFFPNDPIQVPALPNAVWFVLEMFHWRVLRHFIPVIIGWWLAVEASVTFIQLFYDCPDRGTARDFLRRQRRRTGPASGYLYSVTPDTIGTLKEDHVLLRAGGPVQVAVPTYCAAVSEVNGRFLRVIGPGVHNLSHFEYIQAVLDLNRQTRASSDIPLITREGITVTADIHVVFRIDPGEDAPTESRPYPYDKEAVRKAAYAGGVLGNGAVSTWDQAPISRVKGALSKTVNQYGLDQLIAPHDRAGDFHKAIQDEVLRTARAALKKEGVLLERIHISRFNPPEKVSEQYVNYWLAKSRREDALADANGVASVVHEAEIARAEADIMMLQAIVEGVRRARLDSGSSSGYLLALRLVETLERVVAQAQGDGSQEGSSGRLLIPQLALLKQQLLDQGDPLPVPAIDPDADLLPPRSHLMDE